MWYWAPSKLNLFLQVGRPRPDGFHPLNSWFVTTSLADRLRIQLRNTPEIQLTCDDPTIPTDETNLICRAARKLLPAGSGAVIHLEKRIPAGGGLGGGSSDAASTLMALASQAGLHSDLDAIAASLGSDLNFFLHAPSALCEGRGERVTPVPAPRCRAALLLLPQTRLSTPSVFRRFDELGCEPTPLPPLSSQLQTLSATELLPLLFNDLERPAFDLEPGLAELREKSERAVGRPVRMSGSGSTLFTLFDDLAEAQAAAGWWRGGKGGGVISQTTSALAVELCPAVTALSWSSSQQYTTG